MYIYGYMVVILAYKLLYSIYIYTNVPMKVYTCKVGLKFYVYIYVHACMHVV